MARWLGGNSATAHGVSLTAALEICGVIDRKTAWTSYTSAAFADRDPEMGTTGVPSASGAPMTSMKTPGRRGPTGRQCAFSAVRREGIRRYQVRSRLNGGHCR